MTDARSTCLTTQLPHVYKQSLFALPNITAQLTTQEQRQAALLLDFVDNADYANLEKIWKANPKLMLRQVKDKDGNITTPLQRAFYNLDTYTWRPFYEWVKRYNVGLMQEFQRQNIEQKEHINLEPLINSYSEFRKAEDDIIKRMHETPCYKHPALIAMGDRELLTLGQMQRKILPKHMLREYCRKGLNTWSGSATFDVAQLPAPKGGTLYDWSTGRKIKLDSAEFNANFGVSIILHSRERGVLETRQRNAGCGANWCSPPLMNIRVDEEAFLQLFRARTDDLAMLLTLDQTYDKHQKLT